MNVFQIKSTVHGQDRMAEFLKENFISIGGSRTGDLEEVSEQEIGARLAQIYGYEKEELIQKQKELYAFAQVMQDGDYVLAVAQEIVYLGDVGDYYYVESIDSTEEGLCHRRGVTWLNGIPRAELNSQVQELLRSRAAVDSYPFPIATAGLERWAAKLAGDHEPVGKVNQASVQVDPKTIEEALSVLKQALQSEDSNRRERAAIAILDYAKGY